jgi:hypothetical protein
MAEPIIIVRENGLVVEVKVEDGLSGPCMIQEIADNHVVITWSQTTYKLDGRKYKEKKRGGGTVEIGR